VSILDARRPFPEPDAARQCRAEPRVAQRGTISLGGSG
jgi:hypothetical protein